LVANFAGLAMLSVHWFNPLAYWAHRAFRDDQETACDATVLKAEAADRRHSYGSAILKSASCRVPGAACALNHAGALKRRIMIMIDGEKSTARRATGTALALILLAGGLVGTASTIAATETVGHVVTIERHGSTVTVTRDGVTRPATPAEIRQVETADRQARSAERQARRAARAAVQDARRAVERTAWPQAPLPPVAPVETIEPIAPLAPLTPPVPVSIAIPVTRPFVDRELIRAQVRASMSAARAEIARARAEGFRERDEALAEAAVMRRQAQVEAAQARHEARAEGERARREALAEAARARHEARQYR
jgi:hypothetical protein